MKILLIVPDGVAVRNYLYSSFIEELQNSDAEIMIYHQISDAAISEIQSVQKKITNFQRIPLFIESPKARILRESLAYARLLRNKKTLNNNTIMSFWNKNQKGMKLKLLYRLSEIFGFFFSKSYKIILKFETIYTNSISRSKVIKTIEKDISAFNPDFILNLHQRATISAPIISVANALKIKTATVIFSWDNVPKARLISRYDYYFVWSDIMKSELKLLYPEIDCNQIEVVGTPQFEFYFKEEFHRSKFDFFNEFNLDATKKTICFSANDQTSPYEANYLQDICEQLSSLPKNLRPQIIFRRNPVDRSNRFDKVLRVYKNLIAISNPDWRVENNQTKSFAGMYPAYNDIQLLVNTVLHCDLVINLGSTMAHDFSVMNKPCLYLKYNPLEKSSFDVKKVYSFQHFSSMTGLDAVFWVNSKEEINAKILEALDCPENVAKDRKKWMQKIVAYPLQDCSKKIVKSIKLKIHN